MFEEREKSSGVPLIKVTFNILIRNLNYVKRFSGCDPSKTSRALNISCLCHADVHEDVSNYV